MRRLAFSFFVLVSLVHPGSAQSLHDHDRQMSSCLAWRERLAASVRQFGDLGIVPGDDAAVATGLVELMGKRCAGDDPQRISQLYVILLDVLSDQRHQP
ncbi:MAG: hypothetical protein U0987_10280 [Afipia sp.]|nr:hypothetical protein [Afipia sp.]